MNIQKCPKCGVELPVFAENGKHNFCPSSEVFPNRIAIICMKCKIEEVEERWKRNKAY